MMAAVSFLTVFGGHRAPRRETLVWFPAVGAAIGLLLGGLWWAASKAWSSPVAAALVVAGDLAITGLLHFDGLIDCADGLIPPMEKERRLEVMAAPDVGAFGASVAGVTLLARWAALASIRPGFLLLTGLWTLSRTGMAGVAETQPYARIEGGLASAFLGNPTSRSSVAKASLVLGLAGGVGCLVAWRLGPGMAVAATAAVMAVAIVALARRRIGGFTGDVLGACGVLAETAGLVVAAAKW